MMKWARPLTIVWVNGVPLLSTSSDTLPVGVTPKAEVTWTNSLALAL